MGSFPPGLQVRHILSSCRLSLYQMVLLCVVESHWGLQGQVTDTERLVGTTYHHSEWHGAGIRNGMWCMCKRPLENTCEHKRIAGTLFIHEMRRACSVQYPVFIRASIQDMCTVMLIDMGKTSVSKFFLLPEVSLAHEPKVRIIYVFIFYWMFSLSIWMLNYTFMTSDWVYLIERTHTA